MISHSQKGYTLAEMLVIMAIIAIISTVVLTQYRTGEKQNLLRLKTQEVVNNLRRVQNMSLSGQEYKGVIPSLGGFGAHFDISAPSSYVLFADMNGDGQYNDNGTEKIETILISDPVIFSSMNVSPMDIIFNAPDAIINITGGLPQAVLSLNVKNTSLIKTITIKKPGLIDY